MTHRVSDQLALVGYSLFDVLIHRVLISKEICNTLKVRPTRTCLPDYFKGSGNQVHLK